MVDYHIYVFLHFGIIIKQPTKLFSVNSSKKICDILKLNLNYNFFPKLVIMYTHSHFRLKLLDHVHT
jgi:hypothetical protein